MAQQLEYRLGQLAAAIQCSLNPMPGAPAASASSPEDARRFISGVQGAPDGWTFFLELFTRAAAQLEVAFVCLGALTEIVKGVALSRQQDQRRDTMLNPIRTVILRWLQTHVGAGSLSSQPSFIRTKIAAFWRFSSRPNTRQCGQIRLPFSSAWSGRRVRTRPVRLRCSCAYESMHG